MDNNYSKPYANSISYIEGFTEAFNPVPNLWFIYIRCISDDIYKEGYQDGLKEKDNKANTTLPKT